VSNKPRLQKTAKGKYEDREYLDYEEAGDYLGMKRATLFNYIDDLGIETHKFLRDRRKYLAMADVKRIEAIMDKRWLAGPDKSHEKDEKPPVLATSVNNTKVSEKSQKTSIEDIPSHLAPGTVSSGQFAKQHGIKYDYFKNYMRRGIDGEMLDITEEPHPRREGYTLKFLTLAQQEKALDILKRYGKL